MIPKGLNTDNSPNIVKTYVNSQKSSVGGQLDTPGLAAQVNGLNKGQIHIFKKPR